MLSFITIVLLAVTVGNVRAETHTVHFNNLCGFGIPTLIQGQNILSTGVTTSSVAYTSNGPLNSVIAYLQTGGCNFNGEGCTLVETTLTNGFSSTDLSLIPPHSFSVTSGFRYLDGCDGAGADCTSPSCDTAFMDPSQTDRQVGCPTEDVNLEITFCD
ncbi:hypothetical protein C8R44DRAFT_889354 [Mycena epipterygia]|nr:hypothetical protein C8R44DRAFT_889354 [Mycena epipterygia]